MIKSKDSEEEKRSESMYYYCDNLKDCINRNSFILETRRKLKKKKIKGQLS